MSNTNKYLICLVLFFIIHYHNSHKTLTPQPIVPAPVIVVPIPEPVPDVPKPQPKVPSDILIDNYDLAVSCGKKLDKPILFVFTAEWCGYCRSLKKELKSIIPDHKYVVCFLDIDNEINTKLVDQFKIKSLPTSIIIDQKQNKEIKRNTGFLKEAYKSWLN